MAAEQASPKARHKDIARLIRADRLLAHGLPALIIGGALLIAVVWLLTLQLASTLADNHVQRKMLDVAHKAEAVLAMPQDEAAQRQALGWLARFRDVRGMELRDDAGRLLWRNVNTVSQVRRTLPKPGHTLLERRNVDGLPRTMARHHALLKADGKRLHLVLEADVSDLLSSYRQVAVLVAKAITTALLIAIFMMGWLLTLRWREQRELARELQELLKQQQEHDGKDWRQSIEELGAHNAALLRRMLALRSGAANNDSVETLHPERQRA